MGFERLVRAIQNKTSNYDTDIFTPTLAIIEQLSSLKYGQNEPTDIAMRVIADHIRAIAFTIADGQLPSNVKQGYVIRRILRRAVRYGYSKLNLKEPFLVKLIPNLAAQFAEVFPELKAQQEFVSRVILEEEKSFFKTLYDGILIFNHYLQGEMKKQLSNYLLQNGVATEFIEHTLFIPKYNYGIIIQPNYGDNFQADFFDTTTQLPSGKTLHVKKITPEELLRSNLHNLFQIEELKNNPFFKLTNKFDGDTAFIMYDQNGFPLDLIELMARELNWSVDVETFNIKMQEQKDRSRQATKVEKGDWIVLDEEFEKTEFIGYEYQECTTKLVKYREVKDAKQSYFQIVLEKTPFYAESGGQVGDKGILEVGGQKLNVFDTKKENDLIVHLVATKNIDLLSLKDLASLNVVAKIDKNRRSLTENNHSATHLAHAALRQVLGTHVAQKGSLVNEEVLRFDFSHFAKVTDEELAKVETIVNQKIRENIALEQRQNVPIEEAKNLGAMALFGEKYGDFVRVITFDKNYSVELCGGTHVPNTGKIGAFKFIAESSVAAGVRRIEAVTSTKAEELVNAKLKVVDDLVELLKNPKDILKTVSNLLDEKAELQKQIEAYQHKEIQAVKQSLLGKITQKNGVSVIAEIVSLPHAEALRTVAFELKNQVENLFLVLASDIAGKPQIAVMIAENLVQDKGLHAGNIIKELAKEIKGGGGGQAFFATAGGNDVSGLGKVVEKGKNLV
jgi:alanyl-tRNA synthetase